MGFIGSYGHTDLTKLKCHKLRNILKPLFLPTIEILVMECEWCKIGIRSGQRSQVVTGQGNGGSRESAPRFGTMAGDA